MYFASASIFSSCRRRPTSWTLTCAPSYKSASSARIISEAESASLKGRHTGIHGLLIGLVLRLEIRILLVDILVRQCHWHHDRSVIEQIDKSAVVVVRIAILGGSSKRRKRRNDRIDRSSCPRQLGRAVPVLEVRFLSVAFLNVGVHNVRGVRLGFVRDEDLRRDVFARQLEVFATILAAVEVPDFVADVAHFFVAWRGFPFDGLVAESLHSSDNHFYCSRNGRVWRDLAVVFVDAERQGVSDSLDGVEDFGFGFGAPGDFMN